MEQLMRCDGYPYAFDPKACQNCSGRCCVGESGYIWVSPEEISAIALKLSMSKEEFINKYLLKIRYRFTIKEIAYEGGYGCVFFDMEKRCVVSMTYDLHSAVPSHFGNILKKTLTR